MKNYILILFIMNLFLIGLINAEVQTFGTFQQNKCVNLIQTCDNCTFINITSLIYPNSSIALTNAIMTKQGTSYNYTFCSTEALGQYIYNTVGDLNGVQTVQPVNFEITTTGDKVSLSNIIIVIVFLLFALICLILGWTFNKDYWLIKSFFYVGAILMGILALNSGKIIASESLGLSSMGTTGLTIGIVIFSFVLLYLFVHWTIETIKLVKEKQGVRWKY